MKGKLVALALVWLAALPASQTRMSHAQVLTSSSSSSASISISSSSSSVPPTASPSGASTGFVRLRANRLRRPDSCRESLPRKSDELPALVAVGRVREVYPAAEPQPGVQPAANRALVQLSRVIKGSAQLLGADIIVSGFNSSSAPLCPNYVKPNDTYIFLLQQDSAAQDRRFTIQAGNLLSLNLNNLDRINAIAADEPIKRRPAIEEILCEAHYCAYGRCAIVNERAGQVSCQCPDSCSPLPSPVCGSDNATYTNECHLIREGCRLKRPLFVTRESTCAS